LAGVLVGDVTEKYREVHNSGSISCDLGYIVGKAMSFKRNGTRHQAQGARLGEKGRREREELAADARRQERTNILPQRTLSAQRGNIIIGHGER